MKLSDGWIDIYDAKGGYELSQSFKPIPIFMRYQTLEARAASDGLDLLNEELDAALFIESRAADS